MAGHPDDQSYANWRSNNLFGSLSVSLTPGLHPGTVKSIFQYAAVMLRVLPSAGQAQINVNWWLDSAMTLGMGVETFRVNATTAVLVVLPAEAPFVSVDVNNTGAGNFNSVFVLVGTNAHAGRPVYPIVDNHIAFQGTSIAASGSLKTPLSWLGAGNCWLYLNPHDATAKLQFFLTAVDEAGNTIGNLSGPLTPTAEFTRLIVVSPDILILSVFNLDGAAAHVFDGWVGIGGQS